MKKRITAVLLAIMIVGVPVLAYGGSSLSTYVGGVFYRYEDAYLLTGLTFITSSQEQMEVNLGVDFGISTNTTESGEVLPTFFIPVSAGLNFTFPGDPLTFYFGTGLTPVFVVRPQQPDPLGFLIGPYAKSGIRVRVHSIMSVVLELQQDLLIGGEHWVNTDTRILAGINFAL